MNTRTPLTFGSKAFLSFVVLLAVVSVPHFAFSQNSNGPARVVPLILLDDVPLTQAIKNLALQLNLNFIFAPRVPGSEIGPGRRLSEPSVTGRWENVSPQQALADVLKSNNLVMVTFPATTVTRFAPARLGIKPVPASQVGADTNAVLPNVGVLDEPLDETIKTIVEKGLHLNVIFDQVLFDPTTYMKGKITFHWMDITARQALAALLDNYDLLMIEDAANSSAQITVKSKRDSDPSRGAGRGRKQP